VLLYEPDATPLDLRFRLFGTYVRVHPLFWLIMAIFGWQYSDPRLQVFGVGGGLLEVGLWVMCGFVSILLHEFGHIWMGRAFGTHGHILLHSMGGLAIGAADVPYRWQRILVSLAGPGIQLLLYAVLKVLIAFEVIGPSLLDNKAFSLMLGMLLWINCGWAILNLFPIWPLDGGWVVREVCQIASPQKGLVTSLWISVFVGVGVAAGALLIRSQDPRVLAEFCLRHFGQYARMALYVLLNFGSYYIAILFALLAYGSWQALQVENANRRRYWDDNLPWER
jgi:Zn-dependent protease